MRHAQPLRARSGFIHKVTRFARKRLRARVNDRNRRGYALASSFVRIPTWPQREDVNTRLWNERSAPTSARLGYAASEDAPPVAIKACPLTPNWISLSLSLSLSWESHFFHNWICYETKLSFFCDCFLDKRLRGIWLFFFSIFYFILFKRMYKYFFFIFF